MLRNRSVQASRILSISIYEGALTKTMYQRISSSNIKERVIYIYFKILKRVLLKNNKIPGQGEGKSNGENIIWS